MKSVIYETKGRAREFNELAINLFTGCDHQCIYCFGADVTHQTKEAFRKDVCARVSAFEIEQSAKVWHDKGGTRRVLLCFVTDPYMEAERETKLTRLAIEALHEHGLNVIILTKGGKRSTRDFDLLTEKDAYATTLTCLLEPDSLYWEPGAALPRERVSALKEAHDRGIETWVSLEPVIYPENTISLLEITRDFVGHYKVGTMNYHEHGKTIDWFAYGWMMKRKLDAMGVKYYFKRDLLKEMKVDPAQFKQTWVCR